MKLDDGKFASVLHMPPVQEIPASFRPGQPHKETGGDSPLRILYVCARVVPCSSEPAS